MLCRPLWLATHALVEDRSSEAGAASCSLAWLPVLGRIGRLWRCVCVGLGSIALPSARFLPPGTASCDCCSYFCAIEETRTFLVPGATSPVCTRPILPGGETVCRCCIRKSNASLVCRTNNLRVEHSVRPDLVHTWPSCEPQSFVGWQCFRHSPILRDLHLIQSHLRDVSLHASTSRVLHSQ